jgi:hypothetical protein
VYAGSSDDAALNAGVERFAAEPGALEGINRFTTTGNLSVPVVNLHTTGDPIVPFRQASLYADKVQASNESDQFTQLDIDRHGHCTFEETELLNAFSILWSKVNQSSPAPTASR